MSDTGKVHIHGKEYQTVAYRINEFRKLYQDYSIVTDVQNAADLVCVKCTISNSDGRVIATGYAEEVRGSTKINNTSALENCETSAVGRALAFFGLGGTEIASANEVNGAIIAGAKKEVVDYMVKYANSLRENIHSIAGFKEAISNDDMGAAAQCWFELEQEDANILFLAPTKGGILTTQERELIKSSDFRKAYFGEDK